MTNLITRSVVALLIGLAAVGAAKPHSLAGQSDSPEMTAMRQYIGAWRAEDRQAQDGRTFHFVYRLEWFDRAESIVEMLITQHIDDGIEQVLWKGFKGWHSGADTVYYHGFSPGGRAAAGHIELDGDSFVTDYEGWGPTSAGARIRDIFSPVVDGAFTARTLVRPTPDQEWRGVSSDRWTRIDGDSNDC